MVKKRKSGNKLKKNVTKKVLEGVASTYSTGKFIYEKFKSNGIGLITNILMVASPYYVSTLKTIRLDILKTMETKSFESYVTKLGEMNNKIDEIMSDNKALDNDNFWSDGYFKTPFWVEDTPWLYEKFQKNKQRSVTTDTGLTSLTDYILNDKFVSELFENEWMNDQFRVLMSALLSTYYSQNRNETIDRLWPVHLNIDLSYKTNKMSVKNRKDAVKQLIQSCFAGSGPFVLKILQQINIMAGEEIKVESTKLSELAEEIFKSVPPLTEEERKLLYKAFRIAGINKPIGKLLGSASIAEAHFYGENNEDVMKFIKPIYAYYFICECDFLLSTTWKAIPRFTNGNKKLTRQTRQILMYFCKGFSDEFDYQAEYDYTQLGTKNYEVPGKITSVKIKEMRVNPFPVFVMNRIQGSSVDDLIENLENSKRKDVIGYQQEIEDVYQACLILYEKWLQAAIWGNESYKRFGKKGGFFHADMHPGNLFIEVNKDSETGKNKIVINVLDYGSSGFLSSKRQCILIKGLAIIKNFEKIKINRKWKPNEMINYMNSPNIRAKHDYNISVAIRFIKTLNKLCDVKKMSTKQINGLAPLLLDYRSDTFDSFNNLFTNYLKWSPNIETCSHNEFLLFARGLTYLDNLMYRLSQICENEILCPKFPIGNVGGKLAFKMINIGKTATCAGTEAFPDRHQVAKTLRLI
jgi:hypothetical protein